MLSHTSKEELIKAIGVVHGNVNGLIHNLETLRLKIDCLEIEVEKPKVLTYEEEKDFVNKWLGGSEGYSLADWDPTEDRTRWPQIFQRINDKGLTEEFTQKVVDVIGSKIERLNVVHGGFLLMETEAPTLWKALLEMLQERLA